MSAVGVLLVSTYDLGRQPMGLASPAAWLRRAGIPVECVDTSRDELRDDQIVGATLVAFYLPMHTATRLAAPLMARVRALNPAAGLAAYGLYAPLNAQWLRQQGVQHVLDPEAERELAALAGAPASVRGFLQPDRTGLPPLRRYAALQMPDGARRVAGSTDATRGCKHLCRHCPIVPVYGGRFRAIPLDVVMADVRAQVDAGAQHISFGDPDFLNGPTHARRLVERLARECPGVSYDVTIKIEHLLTHAALLPLLRDTGCVFVTSAAESVDDAILARLKKGHTRDDFARAVSLCRDAGLTLSPTFVPFTPWTTLAGYVDLLEQIETLGLTNAVAPIQLAIRLLVTADSALLDLPDLRALLGSFDGEALAWPWRHPDPEVDRLHEDVMQIAAKEQGPRARVFEMISGLARKRAGLSGGNAVRPRPAQAATPPHLTEAWYCCAEPGPAVAGSARTPRPFDYV